MMSDLVENQTPLTQREWVWPVAFDRLLQRNLKHERYVMQLENNVKTTSMATALQAPG